MIMKKAIVQNGELKGREGLVDLSPLKYGNVMFYSKEGINPYRICLKATDVLILEEDK